MRHELVDLHEEGGEILDNHDEPVTTRVLKLWLRLIQKELDRRGADY